MTHTPATGDGNIQEAERARQELADALTRSGVILPSLRLDPVSCTGPTATALIDLGRCNVQTARALAVALRSGDTTGTEPP